MKLKVKKNTHFIHVFLYLIQTLRTMENARNYIGYFFLKKLNYKSIEGAFSAPISGIDGYLSNKIILKTEIKRNFITLIK